MLSAFQPLPQKAEAAALNHHARGEAPTPVEINQLVALFNAGRHAELESRAHLLLDQYPDSGFVWKILGASLPMLGKEALPALHKATELLPDDAEAHFNLGNTYRHCGKLDGAVASYRRALALKPDFAEAHCNLSIAYGDLRQLDDAVASYRRALEIKSDYAAAHSNLGNAYRELGQLDDAVASCRRALALKPDFAEAHYNLGNVLKDTGQLDEAVTSFHRALEIKPDFAQAHSTLLFCLSQSEAVDAAMLFAEHCRFGEQFEAPLRANWPQHANSPDPERRLQIGFVSADLRNHAVASFIEPLLAHLAGYSQLSLHAYYNLAVEDGVTQRLRGYVQHWHPVAGLSDAALAEEIRADGIDILFDLSNHTAHNRLLSFARKPAPVQISWIGYHGTTGLSSMDYYLTDRFLLPPGQFDHQFTEKLVYLPAWAPFLPSAEAPPVNRLPALSNGYLTFGSFNRQSKISRAVIALWSQLLRAVPDSRMVLGAIRKDGQYDTLIAWFAGEGIDRERLDFHPHSNMQDYLALHQQVDVCLDAFPYTGGTTTYHALWMGVPTLTLAGSTVAGHIGAGIMGHVGLDAFIAEDPAAFVQQGLALQGDNFSALAHLRDGLRERFAQSATGQPALIAAGLERALRTMWQRWCAGLPTETFEIFEADMTIPTLPAQSNVLPQQVAADAPLASKSIAIISATRLSENYFWSKAALGLSLQRHLKQDARLSVNIAFENSRGLPEVFNEYIHQVADDAILVFIHDDVWIDEVNFSDAVIAGLENFDVIGVAGNRRRVPNQPAWAFIDNQYTWDDKSNLSGRVAHGKSAFGQVSDFGAVPAECELLDGVFLATKKSSLKQNMVQFDAQFDFHFYDMDFCRSARKVGLRLGTWPVNLTHQSGGAFGSKNWNDKYQRYLNKWEAPAASDDITLSSQELSDKEQELQQAINDVLQTALNHQNDGQLKQAEHIYLEILKIQPKHAAANHALGLMEINSQGALAALPRLEIAVMENPENEQFWISYIGALMQSGPADSVADALELGLKYGLRVETAQTLTANFVAELESSRNEQQIKPTSAAEYCVSKNNPADMKNTMFVNLLEIELDVDNLITEARYNDALGNILLGVHNNYKEPGVVHKSLYYANFDRQLRLLSDALIATDELVAYRPLTDNTLIIATDMYQVGGHSRVIADVVRDVPYPTLVLTDIFWNLRKQPEYFDWLLNSFENVPVTIIVLPQLSLWSKCRALHLLTQRLQPRNILYFNHHQDPIPFVGTLGHVGSHKTLVHHCDHNPSLGNTLTDMMHVDFTDEMARTCAMHLNRETRVLPLYVPDSGKKNFPVAQGNQFSVVTSGVHNKFARTGAMALQNIALAVLSCMHGQFFHIGSIDAEWVAEIRAHLKRNKIAPSRFVTLGAVTSLWNTLASLDAHIYLGSAPVGGGRAAIEAQGCGYPVAYFQTSDPGSVLAVDSIYASKQLGWANLTALSVMLKTISPQLPYLSDLARSLYEHKYSREKFVNVLNEIIK